jgi:hypothetical protein
MFRRPLVLSPRRSAGFLAAWEAYDPKAASPLSDYALHALLHRDVFDARSGYPTASRARKHHRYRTLDQAVAIAMLAVLGLSGLVIGWVLLAP